MCAHTCIILNIEGVGTHTIYKRGCGSYWKSAIRSLTVPLRGRSLSSEDTPLSVVVLVVVVMVVDLVTGGYVGVEME